MMKKYLMMFVLLFLPFSVNAVERKISITCDDDAIKPGETTTCYIKGSVTEGDISAVTATIKMDEKNLNLEDISYPSTWQADINYDILNDINIYTSNFKKNSFDIATIVIKASDNVNGVNSKVSVEDVKFLSGMYDGVNNGDPYEYDIENVSKDIRIVSTINTLSNLSVSNGALVPEFKSDTLNYSLATTEEKITISATPTDKTSKITGDTGELSLKYGTNVFKINVTSESASVKTYTIQVTRPDDRSTDNSLVSLSVNDKEIELIDGVYEYTYEVENNTKDVIIDSIINDENATYVTGYGPRTVTLENGKAEIEIRVKAENEQIQTYKITVATKNANTTTDTNNDKKPTTKDENPKTSDKPIYIIGMILLMSIAFIVYYEKVYLVKEGAKQ